MRGGGGRWGGEGGGEEGAGVRSRHVPSLRSQVRFTGSCLRQAAGGSEPGRAINVR